MYFENLCHDWLIEMCEFSLDKIIRWIQGEIFSV